MRLVKTAHHAAARLRLQDGQRRRRYPHDPSVHGAVAGAVQGVVEGLTLSPYEVRGRRWIQSPCSCGLSGDVPDHLTDTLRAIMAPSHRTSVLLLAHESLKLVRLKDLLSPPCTELRGRYWALKGDFDRAIIDCDAAIRLVPNDVSAYVIRGSAYELKRDFDRAIADLTEAIRLNPKDRDAYMVRAKALMAKGQRNLAILDDTEMIRLDPKDGKPFGDRGSAYWDSGDYDRAFSDFNESLRLNPKSVTGYLGRGLGYEKRGELEKALTDFRAAVAIDPDRKAAIAGIRRLEQGLTKQH
jgi:tetratricopeptide (TPR) repeat protein